MTILQLFYSVILSAMQTYPASQPSSQSKSQKSIAAHILATPNDTGIWTAFYFLQSALELGHSIALVFFNGPACKIGFPQSDTPNHSSPHLAWRELGLQYDISFKLCSGSVARYQTAQPDLSQTLQKPFQLGSLRQLVEAYQQHQMVTFHGVPNHANP